MSKPAVPGLCGKCGAVLSGYAPEGLCAGCLLESALDVTALAALETSGPLPLLTIKDYELLEEIARGGMGVVYRARQISLNRPVAIKMVLGGHLANAAEIKRFRAEAETAAQLQHPNIVAIHEVGEHAGQPFFSMDLVQGRNLAQLVRDEPLPSRKAAAYLKTIAEALQYAHSRGVLHRDLKPSNILIDQNDQPRVTDFGLAKRLTDSQPSTYDPQLTQTGQVLGSPSFIPPEQAAGRRDQIGPASDVYSLGAILYHCLTGRPPFVAETLTQTLRMVAEQEPVAPRLLNAGVPRDLETICLKCLEKDPKRRYDTAQELATELSRFLNDEPIRARPAGVALKVHRWCLRNKALAVAVTVSLALLLLVSIGSPLVAVRFNRERKQAEINARQAQTEAVRSQQIAKFFKEMLRSAGPSVARGRDATIVREILDETSAKAGRELKDQPEVQAGIYSTIGTTFLDIGDHRRAITNFEQAVSSYRLASQRDQPNLAYALSSLGYCQSFTEEVSRGNNTARLGVEMARRCGDKDVLFRCLMNYAASFKAWGMIPREAEPSLREAFELKKQLGNDPVGLATAQHMIAHFSTNKGETEQMLRNALETFQKQLPPGHPRAVQGAFSLGQDLVNNGKYEEAERTLRQALDGFHKTHAPDHPYQSIVLRYLIYALIGQGKMKEAETELRNHVEAFPSNINYYYMLARFRMQHGSPGGATEPLPLDLRTKLEQGQFVIPWAVSLLQVGALAKFQEYRRGYLDVALAHNDFGGKLDTAKVLLLGGGEPQDVERASHFAGLAITNVIDIELYSVEEVRALLEFERGRFADAKQWATTVVTREDGWKPRLCEGWLIRALACARLELPESALVALAEGQEILKENLPTGTEAYLFSGDEWLLARYLASEAKKAVEAIPPGTKAGDEAKDQTDLAILAQARIDDLARKGQLEAASAELRRLITLQPTNLFLAGTAFDLAQVCARQDKLALAEALGLELVELRKRTLGGGYAGTVDARFYLASLYVREHKLAAAQGLYRELAEAYPDAAGHFYGRGGQWKEAAAAFAHEVEAHPDNSYHYRLLAAILLFSGDVQGYRKVCQQLVNRFGTTVDPVEADEIAKASLLRADSGVDPRVAAGLADIALERGKQHPALPWFELQKALAEYRLEHFANAADWAEKALKSPDQLERDAMAYAVQAMAQSRLKQHESARVALGKATELVSEKLPKLDGGDTRNWADVIGANLLLREAEALIKANRAGNDGRGGGLGARQD